MTPVPAQEVWHAEFAHVAVLVSDVVRSAEWYHDVLGWEPVFEADQGPVLGEANGHGGPGTIAMGRIGATNVELVAMHRPPLGPWRRSERYGLMLISIRVSDVPAARARCAAFGAAICARGGVRPHPRARRHGPRWHRDRDRGSRMTRVGFVGVGRMGAAMLRCVVAAGHPVAVFDVDPEAVIPFTVEHSGQVRAAGSAADAALRRRGDRCRREHRRPGARLLPRPWRRAGRRRSGHRGARALDGVVRDAARRRTRGSDTPRARRRCAGQWRVGGAERRRPDGDVRWDRGGVLPRGPVLDTYGGLVLHLGELGSGLDAKLALNVLRYLLYVASQEVMRFVTRTALDPAQFRALAVRSGAVQLTGDFSVGRGPEDYDRRVNNAETAEKDLRAAVARAGELVTELPTVAFAIDRMHALWGVEPPDDRQV